MSIKTLRDAEKVFSCFESETDIPNLIVQDIPVWEIVRFSSFQRLCINSGVIDVGHPTVPRTISKYIRFATNFLTSHVSGMLRNLHNANVLILGHPRLILNDSGQYEDPYSEAYIKDFHHNYYFLEKAFRGQHFKPRLPGNHLWVDDLFLRASLSKGRLIKPENEMLRELEVQFNLATGHSIPLIDIISNAIGRREVLLPFYERLLKRIRPRVGITVAAYQQPEFIEACRNFDIPVIEVQHGIISHYHYGYHHKTVCPSRYYPDYIWLWGNYWKHAAEFSPKIQLNVVGYPLFEKHRFFQTYRKELGCLFVSQGSVGNKIANYARNLRELKPELEIYYRLHPSEFDSWKMKYSDLPEMNITILGPQEGSIYDWFGKIQYVIGGYSTALFEAVCMGCRVGVLNLPGIEYMEPLIEQKGAFKIDMNWQGFFDYDQKAEFDVNSIFEPYSAECVDSLLHSLS